TRHARLDEDYENAHSLPCDSPTMGSFYPQAVVSRRSGCGLLFPAARLVFARNASENGASSSAGINARQLFMGRKRAKGQSRKAKAVPIDKDPGRAAKAAGLRYAHDDMPGIRRVRKGKGFAFLRPDGKPVRRSGDLKRIRALAIPPAWTDVWICPLPNGHLQATGRDERGRKQARYHHHWREVRDQAEHHRMIASAPPLPPTTGARSARSPSTPACSPSAARCPHSAPRSSATSNPPACRAKRSWPPSSSCSTKRTSASATRSTPGRTSPSA